MQLPAFIPKKNLFLGIISLFFVILIFKITTPLVLTASSATKFVILNPNDETVGTPITITVQAQRTNGNVDTNYQNDITLVTDGSATGAGLVDIVNGIGTININDNVAETVNLSLSDTQGTGLDISSVQDVIFSAVASPQENTLALCSDSIDNDSDGLIDLNDPDCIAFIPPPTSQDQTSYGGGGGLNPAPVTLNISGKAYPEAQITLIEKNSLGTELKKHEVIVNENGFFEIIDNKLVSDYYTFSLLLKDKDERQAQAKVFNINLFYNSSANIQNIFFSPTIELVRAVVKKGDFIKIVGYAFSENKVEIELDNIKKYETKANEKGSYELLIDTIDLSFGNHTIKARQLDPNRRESDFSLIRSFVISESANHKSFPIISLRYAVAMGSIDPRDSVTLPAIHRCISREERGLKTYWYFSFFKNRKISFFLNFASSSSPSQNTIMVSFVDFFWRRSIICFAFFE